MRRSEVIRRALTTGTMLGRSEGKLKVEWRRERQGRRLFEMEIEGLRPSGKEEPFRAEEWRVGRRRILLIISFSNYMIFFELAHVLRGDFPCQRREIRVGCGANAHRNVLSCNLSEGGKNRRGCFSNRIPRTCGEVGGVVGGDGRGGDGG